MFELTITILVGIMGGVAVGTQATISAQMSRRVGGAASSLIIHLGGAILSGILLVVRGGEQLQNWRKLSERQNEELLLGVVGRFWTPLGDLVPLNAESFEGFNEPGYAKAVWNFTLVAQAEQATLLQTETRVRCLIIRAA